MKKFTQSLAFFFAVLLMHSLILAQTNGNAVSNLKLTPCLRAFYPLNNSSIDHSGNNLNGTPHNVVPTSDRFGSADSAFLFNGSTSYINLPDEFDLQVKTVNVWFRPLNITTVPGIVFGSDNATLTYGLTSIYVVNQSGENRIYFNQGSTLRYTKINQNEWCMATLVRGVTWSKFYLNTVLIDSVLTGTGHSNDGQTSAKIGCGRNVNTYFFGGKIDELRIFDCELDQVEIDSFYIEGIETCLRAFYPLNNNVNDHSGNGSHGTNHGAVTDTDRFGQADSAYYFNGTNSYIDLPDAFDLPEKTINVWFKAQNITSDPDIVYGSDHANINFGITSIYVVKESGINKIVFNQGGNLLKANINQDEWYMATLVRGNLYSKYYLNTVPVDSSLSATGHSNDGETTAKIGCSRNANTYFFNGIIDELRIFDCALAPDSITSMYINAVIEHQLISDQLKIYPNPASQSITIEYKDGKAQQVSLSIMNLQGQEIIHNATKLNALQSIDVSELSAGIYFLTVQGDNLNFSKKIVIQR